MTMYRLSWPGDLTLCHILQISANASEGCPIGHRLCQSFGKKIISEKSWWCCAPPCFRHLQRTWVGLHQPLSRARVYKIFFFRDVYYDWSTLICVIRKKRYRKADLVTVVWPTVCIGCIFIQASYLQWSSRWTVCHHMPHQHTIWIPCRYSFVFTLNVSGLTVRNESRLLSIALIFLPFPLLPLFVMSAACSVQLRSIDNFSWNVHNLLSQSSIESIYNSLISSN